MKESLLHHKVTRRQFPVAAAALWAAVAATADQTFAQQRIFNTEQLKRLGEELGNWQLSNGIVMADQFPEIKQAADLLTGSYLTSPIRLGANPSNGIAELETKPKFDLVDRRRIIIKSQNRQFNHPLVEKNQLTTIKLSPAVLRSSLRLAIIAKEASQVTDQLQYCRTYISLLREGGGDFELYNPENILTSEAEIITSAAYIQAQLEIDQAGRSWFYTFWDIGSFFRIGGIAFANWYLDELKAGRQPRGRAVDVGFNVVGFMQSKGLIRQQADMFVWSSGKPPEIGSRQFLELFNNFTGRN